jgi:hypothetical protein
MDIRGIIFWLGVAFMLLVALAIGVSLLQMANMYAGGISVVKI